MLGSHRSGPPCGSGVGSLAYLFKMGATRLRFREFALLPKRVTLKWLPRKGGSDSSPSYWPHLRNTQHNASNRTFYNGSLIAFSRREGIYEESSSSFEESSSLRVPASCVSDETEIRLSISVNQRRRS